MHAQSLIRFLEYCNIDYSDKDSFSVQRAKRQINAEFALEESGIVTIDGISYNKSDVLKELELPDFLDRLPHHIKLWQSKVLLRLLERDSIDMDDINIQLLSLANDEDFVYFLAPGMALAFNSVMKSLLKAPDFYNSFLWLRLKVFITPEEEETAYQSLRIFLEEQLRLFKNLNSDTYSQKSLELAPWQLQDWYLLFNNLPDSLYYFNDEFAHVLINFTVQVQRVDKKLCLAISSRLTQMKHVSYNYQKLIIDNHTIYTGAAVGSKAQKRKSPHMGWIATAVVITLLRLLMHTKSCNEDNNAKNIQLSDYVTKTQSNAPVNFWEVRKDFYSKIGLSKTATITSLNELQFKNEAIYLAFQTDAEGFFPVIFTNNSDAFVTMHNSQGFDEGLDIAPHNSIIIGDSSLRRADLLIVPVNNLSKTDAGSVSDTSIKQAVFIAPKNYQWLNYYAPAEMINLVDDLSPYQLPTGKKQLKVELYSNNSTGNVRQLTLKMYGADEVKYLK